MAGEKKGLTSSAVFLKVRMKSGVCLRMVPPFVTAHMFCASRDIQFS